MSELLGGGEAGGAATGMVMGTGMEKAGNDSAAHIPALVAIGVWTLRAFRFRLVLVLEAAAAEAEAEAAGMTAMPRPEGRALGSGVYSLISPGSSGSGPQGSCSLQDSFPSSLEMKRSPSRCWQQ